MKLPYFPVAVIFDMDGLIFDTEALYREAFIAASQAAGLNVPIAIIQGALGVPWASTKLSILKKMGPNFPVDQYGEAIMEHFALLAATALRLKPGIIELLDLLDELQLPRAIATSSSHATVQSHLSAHGLAGRFDAIIAYGDYAASKPSPDPFLTAANRLGVDPVFCLALEDSFNGVRSASTAGMTTFMVPDLLQPTPDVQSLCAGVVSDLNVVRELILAASLV